MLALGAVGKEDALGTLRALRLVADLLGAGVHEGRLVGLVGEEESVAHGSHGFLVHLVPISGGVLEQRDVDHIHHSFDAVFDANVPEGVYHGLVQPI